MFDWLTSFIEKHETGALNTSALISLLNFIANIVNSLSDGEIDGTEFHKLASSSSAVQLVLLVAIMIYLRNKKK